LKRDEATRRLVELLERVSEGGTTYLEAVDEVSVFGSYAVGALTPNDVDVAVEYTDATGLIAREQLKRMFAGRNTETPFTLALRGSRRGLNIVFNARERLEAQGGFTFVTLWRRGDPLDVAVDRLQAITRDPDAVSAPREHVHPLLEGFEKNTLIDGRKRLLDLDQQGVIRLRRLQVERDLQPRDRELDRRAGWGYSETSPRRSATRALLAQLEAEGFPMEGSDREVLISHDLHDRPFATIQHGGERLDSALDDAIYHPAGRSYCVLNLTGKHPFTVLEIEAVNPDR
jgi:hypothetical protein